MRPPAVILRQLGMQQYETVWQQMQHFTDQRTKQSIDEIWLVEHSPVFTLGQAGKREHLLKPGKIPVIQTDRGGQVTYHGPGQLVLYILLDLRRNKIGIRQLVTLIEESIIGTLRSYDINSNARKEAPGVYVDGRKIAALGLRVRRGCSYHGLSLNVKMDLGPFNCINPCGHANLEVTQLADLGGPTDIITIGEMVATLLCNKIGYILRMAE